MSCMGHLETLSIYQWVPETKDKIKGERHKRKQGILDLSLSEQS